MAEMNTTIRMLTRGAALGLAAFALGGCLGNSGGGGGGAAAPGTSGTPGTPGGPGAIVEPDTAPTQLMPVAGRADYQGGLEADLKAPGSGETLGNLQADVDLTVDFAAAYAGMGGMAGIVDSRISNLRGQFQGEDFTLDNELTGDTGISSVGIAETNLDVPGVGNVETRTGSIMVNHIGSGVDEDGNTWNADLQLGGMFFGNNAEIIYGPAGGKLQRADSPTDAIAVGGNWRAEKQ